MGEASRQRHTSLLFRIRAKRLPNDLVAFHRLGQALQLEGTDQLQTVGAAATSHALDQVGDEDLPTVGPGTETRSLDDRVPEVVLVLFRRFSATHPDPQADRRRGGVVLTLDFLLHPDSALEGR